MITAGLSFFPPGKSTAMTSIPSTLSTDPTTSGKIIASSPRLFRPSFCLASQSSAPLPHHQPFCTGASCNVSMDPCLLLQPCQNNATCTNTTTSTGYACSCPPQFAGKNCEIDQRPCQPLSCRNNGLLSSHPHCTHPLVIVSLL